VSLHRGPTLPYSLIAGVTPCAPGWLLQAAKIKGATFAPEKPRVYESFLEILTERPSFEVAVVNAPIGYLDTPDKGPRTCDLEARALVGVRRGGSIHNAPSRAVLEGLVDPREARLDTVTISLLSRYREVAKEMSPFRQRLIYEGHPELSFYQLNKDTPMKLSKKLVPGRDERLDVLETHLPGLAEILEAQLEGVAEKHVYDGLALLWTARRVWGRAAHRMPKEPEWDSQGLRMEFVF